MSVSLHIGSSFPAAWESVLLPWFRRVALAPLETPDAVAVITPSPSAAVFLRAKLLEHEIALLGLKFITPTQLREIILGNAAGTLPLREHLRLLLAIAAESIGASEHTNLNMLARSISRAPDNLLRAFDRAAAAGWDFRELASPGLRDIARQFQTLVRSCGFQQVHEADRAAIETAATRPQVFSDLLLFGFTAAHWPLWPLLRASIASARGAEVILEYPREQGRATDQTWIGTWEEHFGATQPFVEPDRDRPFTALIRSADDSLDAATAKRIQFLIGINTTEEAKAISAVALDFLSDSNCTRLGILFHRAGALPRLVSEFLTRANIPHNDAIGHLAPGEFEQPQWKAWLELQRNRRLEPLLRFLDLHPRPLDQLSLENVRDKLRRAYHNILIDDLDVLREYCAKRSDEDTWAKIAKLLAQIEFLPAQTTLEEYLGKTKTIFAQLGWEARWKAVDQLAQNWANKVPLKLSRATYLAWLEEITDSFTISRAPTADQRYSRIHLLLYSDAEAHEWSHLICAGLNQGAWPPSASESGFLPDAQINELNRRAMRTGKQGEGHSIIGENKTFLLGSDEERRIAVGRFAAAIESVDKRLAFTASLLQELAPERFWNPSELLSQAYFAANNATLSQQTMSRLQARTAAWLRKQNMFEPPTAKPSDIAGTRIAYDARRTPDVPFGEYEFALREPINRQITLRVTQWDKVVKTPALIWLKTYLGVENQEADLNQWNAATGTWVHDWSASIGGTDEENLFVPFPTPTQIAERIAQAGRQLRTQVHELCAAAGRAVPDWWVSGWANAFALTACLTGKVAEVENSGYLATEWILHSPQSISLSERSKLRLAGRIDLILAETKPQNSGFSGANLWIVDYKTGNVKALTVSGRTPELRAASLRKRLVRGDAIQLGLYGLAARELGAGEIDLSILSLRTELDRPQLKLTELTSYTDFWNELYRIQEEGVFGLRGPIRSEFGFNPDYPLATLPIDKEFLDEKWVLTHPAFADDEDDWS